MGQSSKPSFLLLVLVLVMGMGGWNLLVADFLFNVYRLIPKEVTTTKESPKSHQDTGEKSAIKHPPIIESPTTESDEDSVEESDLDVFTMVATNQRSKKSIAILPGIPSSFAANATRFSSQPSLPIGVV